MEIPKLSHSFLPVMNNGESWGKERKEGGRAEVQPGRDMKQVSNPDLIFILS